MTPSDPGTFTVEAVEIITPSGDSPTNPHELRIQMLRDLEASLAAQPEASAAVLAAVHDLIAEAEFERDATARS